MKITIDLPLVERLNVDLSKAVRKGASLAVKIVKARSRAGRAADGAQLPGANRWRETGEMIESIEAAPVKGLRVRIAPTGYHTEGGAERAAAGKRVTKKIRKAASKAAVKERRARGLKGAALKPNAMVMHAQQQGAVGGKKAGSRPVVEVMTLSDAEEAQVVRVIEEEVARQVSSLESGGSVLDGRKISKVLQGKR